MLLPLSSRCSQVSAKLRCVLIFIQPPHQLGPAVDERFMSQFHRGTGLSISLHENESGLGQLVHYTVQIVILCIHV